MNPFFENREKARQPFESFESENMEFPEHLHNHTEILMVCSGQITVRIMEEVRELQEGDCAFIFPQQIHSYHSPAESRVRLYIFDSSLAGAYLYSLGKTVPCRPFISRGELPGDGLLALERLYALSRGGFVPRDAALCSAWIQVLFSLVWPRLALSERKLSGDMELTCGMVRYIMEHFQEDLNLESLAHELHANKYYLSNIFSGQLHTNFRQYLNRFRVEYAAQLMKETHSPLTEIWAEAGFQSQRSFNRAFSEIMGMPPREYRRCHGIPSGPVTVPSDSLGQGGAGKCQIPRSAFPRKDASIDNI